MDLMSIVFNYVKGRKQKLYNNVYKKEKLTSLDGTKTRFFFLNLTGYQNGVVQRWTNGDPRA